MSYALNKKRAKGAFLSRSRPSHLAPSVSAKRDSGLPPPDGPYGDWTLRAGKNGEYLARPPVKINFKGTLPGYRPDSRLSKARNDFIKKAMQDESRSNEKVLDEALMILSQSPTGRDLLERMTQAGYEVVFDDNRTRSLGAGGLCDPANKKIILGSTDDPEYLALVLGHEAVHAVQYTTNNIFPNSSHTPQTAIKLSFAIEADAYAQQTQIALELKHGDPNGPKSQWKMDGPLQQMRKRFANIVSAAEKTLTKKENLTNGAAVAAAFEGFYDNIVLRSFYEDAHMSWAENLAPQLFRKPGDVKHHFFRDLTSDDIASNLKHKGVAYLKVHTPSIDFADARHSGLTEGTQKRIHGFYKNYRPDDKLPKIKTFGVHVKDASRWLFGRDADTNAVILKNNKLVRNRKGPRGPKI
ncbi:MAG: hypothetical protein EA357_02515 [Micavibrio sp.]|nr:MAG: hypothetical protein EA357_02515 [Micavibrio sp.]